MCAAVRRQPVARGGMFSPQRATFSKETQELLKGEPASQSLHEGLSHYHMPLPLHAVMMEESKLTSFQQRQLREKMKSK